MASAKTPAVDCVDHPRRRCCVCLIWKGTGRWKPEDRVYRIGWDPDPPFQAVGADAHPTGLAIELVREAARRRGIRHEWVRQPGGADAALRDQKVDLWPLLTVIPERKGRVHITEPYLETEHCFLVRAESGFTEIRDLARALISYPRLADQPEESRPRASRREAAGGQRNGRGNRKRVSKPRRRSVRG